MLTNPSQTLRLLVQNCTLSFQGHKVTLRNISFSIISWILRRYIFEGKLLSDMNFVLTQRHIIMYVELDTNTFNSLCAGCLSSANRFIGLDKKNYGVAVSISFNVTESYCKEYLEFYRTRFTEHFFNFRSNQYCFHSLTS